MTLDGYAALTSAVEDIWTNVLTEFQLPGDATEFQLPGDAPGQADLTTSFFNSGGNSILAVIMLGRIYEAFGIDVHFEDFVDAPTIQGLTSLVAKLATENEEFTECR